MDFKQALAHAQEAVEGFVAQEFAKRDFGPLAEPMEYAVLNGGKRLRAFLVLETARLHQVPQDQALYAAAAIECIHAYSLVHDDLPAMDDDDLRRGKPTVHIKWDDATAILVGDGLQSVAFELVTDPALPDANIRAELARSLAVASGSEGMVLGQALDIAAETGGANSVEVITQIQSGKTGALIQWSAQAGARLAGADPTALGRFAAHIGLAFQIQDDVLDVEGSEAETGKRLQKDDAAGKATFVSLLGLDQAKKRAADEVDQALGHLSEYTDIGHLSDLAKFVISRTM